MQEYLTVGTVYSYSILKLCNYQGHVLFDLIQHEDGTIESIINDLDEATTLLFKELTFKFKKQGKDTINQKDKDKILTDIRMIGPTGRSDLIFFLIGYCDNRPGEFWQGMAAFLHLDIK